MLAVLICTLVNAAILTGLVGGIVVAFVRSRHAIADALAFAPPAVFTPTGFTTSARSGLSRA